MAMAMLDSVTVSIGLDTMGVRKEMRFVNWDPKQTSGSARISACRLQIFLGLQCRLHHL